LWQLGFERLIFCFEVGDDVLLVSIDPTGHHSDENLQNHGDSWGCEYRRAHVIEYTANPRDFNGVASANFFNTTTHDRRDARGRQPERSHAGPGAAAGAGRR